MMQGSSLRRSSHRQNRLYEGLSQIYKDAMEVGVKGLETEEERQSVYCPICGETGEVRNAGGEMGASRSENPGEACTEVRA